MPNAIILAAGRGQRLRPLTDTTPKALLWAGKHRLIEYHLFALAKAGIQKVVINCAHLFEQFKPALGNGKKYGVHIDYSVEPVALETGGGIFKALPLLGPEPFIVVNADIFTEYDFGGLPKSLWGLAHIVLVDNPGHHLEGDFVLDESGNVAPIPRFENEKILHTLTYSGIGVYSPVFFKDCKPGCFPLAPLLQRAMASGQVRAEHYSGTWIDVGTETRLKEAGIMASQSGLAFD